MAKRYDQKTKDEVVAFIEQYNTENGRGGQSAAAKKWNLNPITIKSWMEKAGVNSPGKSAKKRKNSTKAKGKPGPKPGKKASVTRATAGSLSGSLQRMMEIQEQIASLQAEYDALKGTL